MTAAEKKIDILIPCFNESAVIEGSCERLLTALKGLNYSFQFIFVDDGSGDDTVAKLLKFKSETDVPVKILELSRNFGKEAALSAGIEVSTGDALIILDADLQDPPEYIPSMLREWENGHEVVALRRADRTSDSFFKKTFAYLFYWIANLFSSIEIPKNVGDARLIDRSVGEALRRLPENTRFMKGLFAWVGFEAKLIDIKREPRIGDETKQPSFKLFHLAVDGLTSFSSSLLRLWFYIGLVTFVYSFFHGSYIIVRVFTHGTETPGYASLAVILLFFSGIQMMGIGIMGEYLGRIFMETKRRPLYLVRRTHE